MDEVKIVQLIRTTNKRVGTGVEASPIRCVEQYWNMDGTLLFEYDPMLKQATYHPQSPPELFIGTLTTVKPSIA